MVPNVAEPPSYNCSDKGVVLATGGGGGVFWGTVPELQAEAHPKERQDTEGTAACGLLEGRGGADNV